MGQLDFQGQAGIHSSPLGEAPFNSGASSWTLLRRHSHAGSAEIFSSNMKREQRALYLPRVVAKCEKLEVSDQLLPRPTFLQGEQAQPRRAQEPALCRLDVNTLWRPILQPSLKSNCSTSLGTERQRLVTATHRCGLTGGWREKL